MFPSSSAIGQKPGTMGTEMSSPYPDHEYVVWSDNAASDTVESAGLMYFSLNDGVEINGANRWGLIFGIGGNNSAQYYHLLTSSGSSPSSEM